MGRTKPRGWYQAVIKTIRYVMDKSKVDSADVKAIGLSGQMHGLVMLDKDNNILRPSIIWCDQRTADEWISDKKIKLKNYYMDTVIKISNNI